MMLKIQTQNLAEIYELQSSRKKLKIKGKTQGKSLVCNESQKSPKKRYQLKNKIGYNLRPSVNEDNIDNRNLGLVL